MKQISPPLIMQSVSDAYGGAPTAATLANGSDNVSAPYTPTMEDSPSGGPGMRLDKEDF